MDSLPKGLHWWKLGWTETGTWAVNPDLPLGPLPLESGTEISRKAKWEQSWGLTPGIPIGDAGMPSSVLTAVPKTPPRMFDSKVIRTSE